MTTAQQIESLSDDEIQDTAVAVYDAMQAAGDPESDTYDMARHDELAALNAALITDMMRRGVIA